VVELAFHHPVRLAVQTALLDNLSHGRLIVGTGRGSAYNHYEYLGFGLTMEDGLARLEEAEQLLVASWTGEGLRHQGEHWNVEFPFLRPRPFQQPHPPLVRACISEASTVKMAEIGRPVMIGIQTLSNLQLRLERYRATMLDAGFSEAQTEATMDQCWASRDLYVADSYDEALEVAAAGFERERTHFRRARELYNPGGFPPPDPNRPIPAGEVLEQAFILGTPSQVAEQVAEMRDIGVRNLMLKLNTGEMDTHRVRKSMRLFADQVMPLFS
jgi:alkanesulfonate monooxygenase SsuD/methylene tetrahydromethanopterin reductase-like flavin-dependent oxidoreductase (luciferase family)